MKKISKTDAEWKQQLSELAYKVTREHATERAFSHEDFPKGPGRYDCICCGAELFQQDDKFESGCGWPSFSAPASPENIGESSDTSLGMRRLEVHCNACAAHLGHVFEDGPTEGEAATGLRYCINGVALAFTADEGTSDS